MKEQICLNCGIKFNAYGERKYCSKKCYAKKMWENRERGKKTKIVCLNCKKEFELLSCETRVKLNAVHYCSLKCRDEARKKGKNVKCKNCGKEFYTTRNECCSEKCSREYIKKNYKHKLYMENGYLAGYEKDYNKKGNYKLHRKTMEDYLGRKLNDNEIVHHIDGNKLNNDISNLQVMTRSEHSRYHRLKEISEGKKLF